LDVVKADLEKLDTDLENAEEEIQANIDEIPTDKEGEMDFGMTEGLLILVLILLVIILLVTLMHRGKAGEHAPEPKDTALKEEKHPEEEVPDEEDESKEKSRS
jgi:hypothetical protein